MKGKSMNDNAKLVLGLVTGAVAGAVTALLLAPSSGEETRRKLMKTAQRVREDINDTVQSGIDRINELRSGMGEEMGGGDYGTGRTGTSGMGRTGGAGSSMGSTGATGSAGTTGGTTGTSGTRGTL